MSGALQIADDGAVTYQSKLEDDVFIRVTSWDRDSVGEVQIVNGVPSTQLIRLKKTPRQTVELPPREVTGLNDRGLLDKSARVEITDGNGEIVSVRIVKRLGPEGVRSVFTRLNLGSYELRLVFGSLPPEVFAFDVLSSAMGSKEKIEARALVQ